MTGAQNLPGDLPAIDILLGLPVEETLQVIERQLAHLPTEVCVVLNAAGLLVLQVVGTETMVEFTASQCAQARDGYLTHNHPAGTGLSFLDVRTAHRLNLRQMRVVANVRPAVVHALNRPTGGWQVAECENCCNAEVGRVQKKFRILPQATVQEQQDALKKAQRQLGRFVLKLLNKLHLSPEQRLLS